MRTPETFYFNHGSITFKRIDPVIQYKINKWNKEGTQHSTIETGIVKDEADLKQLLALQDLGSVT